MRASAAMRIAVARAAGSYSASCDSCGSSRVVFNP
jgi:hypothetical protein